MKRMKYFVFALLGLGLFACNSDDDNVTPDSEVVSKGPKSITLKINGVTPSSETRSLQDPAGISDMKDSLKDVTVYFVNTAATSKDSSILFTYKVAKADELVAIISATGYKFHNIHKDVNKVVVVGNREGKTLDETSYDDLKKSVMYVGAQQNASSLILFGEDGLTFTGTDTDGIGGHTGEDQPVYKSSPTIKPLVARIEVTGIQCTDLGAKYYNSVQLRGLGVLDFWAKSKLSEANSIEQEVLAYYKDNSGTIYNKANTYYVYEPGQGPDTPPANYYEFGKTSPFSTWSYNDLQAGITDYTLDSAADIYYPNVGVGAATTKVFAYNFFPKAINDLSINDKGELASKSRAFPTLKLWVKTNPKPGVSGFFDFVTTADFVKESDSSALPAPQPGQIYRLSLAFPEDAIGPWDSQKQCIIVGVQVADWVVNLVKPEYK